MPLRVAGLNRIQAEIEAGKMLTSVGLASRSSHYPSQLSGGERQRVAIARALVTEPALILADEPTGALDSEMGQVVMDLLLAYHRDQGATVVLVTHDAGIAQQCQRILHIQDGRMLRDEKVGH